VKFSEVISLALYDALQDGLVIAEKW